jgi:hypothetical protein
MALTQRTCVPEHRMLMLCDEIGNVEFSVRSSGMARGDVDLTRSPLGGGLPVRPTAAARRRPGCESARSWSLWRRTAGSERPDEGSVALAGLLRSTRPEGDLSHRAH